MKTCNLEPLYEINLQNRYSSDFNYQIDNIPHQHENNAEVSGPYLHDIKMVATAPIKNSASTSGSNPTTSDIEYHDASTTPPFSNPTITQITGLAYNPDHFGVDANGLLYIKKDFFIAPLTVVNGTIDISDLLDIQKYSISNGVVELGDSSSHGSNFQTKKSIPISAFSKLVYGLLFDYWTVDSVNGAPANLQGSISDKNSPITTFVMPFNNPMIQMLPVQCTAHFKIQTFNILSNCGSGGTISPMGMIAVNWAGSQSYTITAGENKHIHQIIIDGNIVLFGANGNDADNALTSYSYTFSNVKEDHSIYADFVDHIWTVTFNIDNSNAASFLPGVATTQYVSHGGSAAAPSYVMSSCYYSRDWNRSLDHIESDTTITLQTSLNTYTVTYIVAANGYISGSATQYLPCSSQNNNVSTNPVCATPNSSAWRFLSWNDGSTSSCRSDTVVGNTTYIATMTANIVSLLVNGGSGSGMYQTGDIASVTADADPDACLGFTNWSRTSGDSTISNAYSKITTIVIGTQNTVIDRVISTPMPHDVHVYGQSSISDHQIYSMISGSTMTLTGPAVPDGSTFSGWTCTAGNINGSVYTAACSSAEVRPSFTDIPKHTLTVSGGTITGVGSSIGSYAEGVQISITQNVSNFNNWSMSPLPNTALCSNYSAPTTNVVMGNQDVTMTANIVVNQTYLLTVTNGTGGGYYAAGAVVSISTSALPNYNFAPGWSSSAGGSFSNAVALSTTFTMPSNNVVVTPNFTLITYTLSYNADQHGSLAASPNDLNNITTTAQHGSVGPSICCYPDDGYMFVSWSDSTSGNAIPNPRQDTNIQNNINVTANTSIIQYTVSIVTDGDAEGKITTPSTGAGSYTVSANSQFVLELLSDTVEEIIVNDTPEADIVGSYSFGPIIQNTVIYIKFGTSYTNNSLWYDVTPPRIGCVMSPGIGVITASERSGTIAANKSIAYYYWTRFFDADVHYNGLNQMGGDPSDFFSASQGDTIYVNAQMADGTSMKRTLQRTAFDASWHQVTDIPCVSFGYNGRSDRGPYVYGVMVSDALKGNVRKVIIGLCSENKKTFPIGVNYVAGPNGKITGTPIQMVSSGSTSSAVTAVGLTGYFFKRWNDGSTTAKRSDVITSEVTYTAYFEEGVAINYSVDSSSTAWGTISGTLSQTVKIGAYGSTVTAKPKTGCVFIQWSDGNIMAARSDIGISGGKSVTAIFKPILKITYKSNSTTKGTVVGISPQSIIGGTNGTLVTATPKSGHSFIKWSDNNSTVASRTDSNMSNDLDSVTVTANFS